MSLFLSLCDWLFFPFPNPIYYLLLWIYIFPIQNPNYFWYGKSREERKAEICFIASYHFYFNFYTKKWCQKNPNGRWIYGKKSKTFASQPAQSLVRCQDGKFIIWGSEWSPPAMTQNWRKSDPSPPLKFTTEIIKVLAIFFLISFSLIFWFSGFHAWPFLWPLLLSSNRYPEINLLELFYSSVPTETDSLSPCCLLKVTFPHSYGDSNSAT